VMAEFLLYPNVEALTISSVFESEMVNVYSYLIAGAIVCVLITAYVEKVLPKEYGVAEPLLWPLYSLIKLMKGTDKQNSEYTPLLAQESLESDASKVVVVRDLKKHFAGKKALDGLSLEISHGECLGLLGPNGAGKSTLAHVLCGMSSPTSGFASVSGYNISNQMPLVRTVLGLCPQHEIVWEDLTVLEHLLFYLRLKNTPKNYEMYEADRILDSVGLLGDKGKRSSQLSGGMKRRLSIAISLVGNPKCLILDEPTTGLDPDTRRSVWDMIQTQKQGRAIILTTHNMEEADTLSDRIAIVSRGNLVCIGNQLELKKRYGKGYKLSINTVRGVSEDAKKYIQRLFPNAQLDVVSAGTMFLHPHLGC